MRLTRCYVPEPLRADSEALLPAGPSAHLTRVLRLRPGAALRLFDGRGGEYDATLRAIEGRGAVRVHIGAHHAIERESPVRIALLQCLLRAERMDWLVQKATELGATRIVAVASQHGLVRLDAAAAERRREHWRAIAIGACEQSGRNRLPQLQPIVPLEQACREAAAEGMARLMLDPTGTQPLASALAAAPGAGATAAVTLLIGPEGGFIAEELLLAQQHGFIACRLGPRILRAETAPLAALACLQTLLGDFGAE